MPTIATGGMPLMRTIKGPGIFLAQFIGELPPHVPAPAAAKSGEANAPG